LNYKRKIKVNELVELVADIIGKGGLLRGPAAVKWGVVAVAGSDQVDY